MLLKELFLFQTLGYMAIADNLNYIFSIGRVFFHLEEKSNGTLGEK